MGKRLILNGHLYSDLLRQRTRQDILRDEIGYQSMLPTELSVIIVYYSNHLPNMNLFLLTLILSLKNDVSFYFQFRKRLVIGLIESKVLISIQQNLGS